MVEPGHEADFATLLQHLAIKGGVKDLVQSSKPSSMFAVTKTCEFC